MCDVAALNSALHISGLSSPPGGSACFVEAGHTPPETAESDSDVDVCAAIGARPVAGGQGSDQRTRRAAFRPAYIIVRDLQMQTTANSDSEFMLAAPAIAHIDLCCGIGGMHEAVKLARIAGVNIGTTLALDCDVRTAKAYAALHPAVATVIAGYVQDPVLRAMVCKGKFKFATAGMPCVDYTNAGLRLARAAAQVTLHLVNLVMLARFKVTLFENVPQMLTSDTWQTAEARLHARGYDTYVIVMNAQQCGTASIRTRALIVVVRASESARALLQKMGAMLNAMVKRMPPGMTVKGRLGCAQDTYYMQPRDSKKPGVLSANAAYPSMTSTQPGVPSKSYVAREKDVGPVSEARVLSMAEVAALMTWNRELPPTSRSRRQQWLADLAMPQMIYAPVHAILHSGLCDLAPSSTFVKGETIMHQFDAPPPLWLTSLPTVSDTEKGQRDAQKEAVEQTAQKLKLPETLLVQDMMDDESDIEAAEDDMSVTDSEHSADPEQAQVDAMEWECATVSPFVVEEREREDTARVGMEVEDPVVEVEEAGTEGTVGAGSDTPSTCFRPVGAVNSVNTSNAKHTSNAEVCSADFMRVAKAKKEMAKDMDQYLDGMNRLTEPTERKTMSKSMEMLYAMMYAEPSKEQAGYEEAVVPTMPPDFGEAYEGTTVRVMFSTGWSQGKLVARTDDVRAGHYRVLFEGEQTPREVRLRGQQYSHDKWAPVGAWCILQPAIHED